jgi:hypothetical protein
VVSDARADHNRRGTFPHSTLVGKSNVGQRSMHNNDLTNYIFFSPFLMGWISGASSGTLIWTPLESISDLDFDGGSLSGFVSYLGVYCIAIAFVCDMLKFL